MKTKITSIIMITVVLAIWIIISFKVYDTYFSEKEVHSSVSLDVNEVVSTRSPELDSFMLKLDYDDPFLKRKRSRKKASITTINPNVGSKNQHKKPLLPKVEVQFPNVVYLGNMINSSSNKINAIVLVNNKEFLVSGGEIIEGIEIISISKSSILVRKDEVSKSFDLRVAN